MLSVLTTLCGAICFWTAPQETQTSAPPSASSATPYHDSVVDRPILQLDTNILLAPVERYTGRMDSRSSWWNPRFFGKSAAQMADMEQDWKSPLLAAYHQFVAGGGENGMAITFQVNGQPACLLEAEVLSDLDRLITHPAGDDNHLKMFLAWHEYGHCVYHAKRGGQVQAATRPDMESQERYRIELFADAFAMTQMWDRHRLDALEMIVERRERGLILNSDSTHWTVPGVTSWREYLGRGGDDHPIETLYTWVVEHDWVSIRDGELAQR